MEHRFVQMTAGTLLNENLQVCCRMAADYQKRNES